MLLRTVALAHSVARASALVLIVAAALYLVGVSPAHAYVYPASYWTTKTMTVPVPSCVNAARQALQKSGIGNLSSDSMSVGGTTPTTRGYIVCVRLPKAGACNGDGATAVIVTAGDDAKTLRDKIAANFAIPHLIDCG